MHVQLTYSLVLAFSSFSWAKDDGLVDNWWESSDNDIFSKNHIVNNSSCDWFIFPKSPQPMEGGVISTNRELRWALCANPIETRGDVAGKTLVNVLVLNGGQEAAQMFK